MKNNDRIEEILQNALSAEMEPSKDLQMKIMYQAKEQNNMKRKIKKRKPYLLIAAIMILAISTTAVAAYQYLTADQVAEINKDDKLKYTFQEKQKEGAKEYLYQESDSGYEVTLLGIASGENISSYSDTTWELYPERTYAAVAIARKDGAPMETVSNPIFVSPLIQGLDPNKYNIVTMDGKYQENMIDGICYRMMECNSLEFFADRELYLAVTEGNLYDPTAYSFETKIGIITANQEYDNLNILFKLQLDPSKADAEQAEKYLKEMEAFWGSSAIPEESEDAEDGEASKEEYEIPDGNNLWTIQKVMAEGVLLENSVKVITTDGEGYASFPYGDGGLDIIHVSIFEQGTDGYVLNGMSEDGTGKKSFVIYHKDGKGTITGMVYVI